jgi:hypothetical protein
MVQYSTLSRAFSSAAWLALALASAVSALVRICAYASFEMKFFCRSSW